MLAKAPADGLGDVVDPALQRGVEPPCPSSRSTGPPMSRTHEPPGCDWETEKWGGDPWCCMAASFRSEAWCPRFPPTSFPDFPVVLGWSFRLFPGSGTKLVASRGLPSSTKSPSQPPTTQTPLRPDAFPNPETSDNNLCLRPPAGFYTTYKLENVFGRRHNKLRLLHPIHGRCRITIIPMEPDRN